MQWIFLVLAAGAALVELHTGTFYLAAVAAAALATAVGGIWINPNLLIFVFAILCAMFLVAVKLHRRHGPRGDERTDFDVGQIVTMAGAPPEGNSINVHYRGAIWEAIVEDGSPCVPGNCFVITRRTDKLLHIVSPHPR